MKRRNLSRPKSYIIGTFIQSWVDFRNRVFKTNKLTKHKLTLLASLWFTVLCLSLYNLILSPTQPLSSPQNIPVLVGGTPLVFILIMQIRSYGLSRSARNSLDEGNERGAVFLFLAAGEFEQASSIIFNWLESTKLSDYYDLDALHREYFKALHSLSARKQMQCMSSDAMQLDDEKWNTFLEIFSVFLQLPESVLSGPDFDRVLEKYMRVKEILQREGVDVSLVKITLIEATLKAIQSQWSEVIAELNKIQNFKWSNLTRFSYLYDVIRRKSYSITISKWFVRISFFRINVDLFPSIIYESLAKLIFERWGEGSLIEYMTYVADTSEDSRHRYAPYWKILADVLDIAQSKKLKPFLIENLSFLLGYTSRDKERDSGYNLTTIIVNYFKDYDFLRNLLQKGISLIDEYHSITDIVASYSKICGLHLRHDRKKRESIWFFETAVRIGLRLSDKTIAETSTTYLTRLYIDCFGKKGFIERIDRLIEDFSKAADSGAIVLASIIKETHHIGWIEQRDEFITRYNSLSSTTPLADGLLYYIRFLIEKEASRLEQALEFLLKSAQGYYESERYRSAGERWLYAGSLSWQIGKTRNLKPLYERAISSFKEGKETWYQTTLLASLNLWFQVKNVMKERLEVIINRINEIEELLQRKYLFREFNDAKEEKYSLLFERSVIEIVISACESIDDWENDNYIETQTRLMQVKDDLQQYLSMISDRHPAAGFVHALNTVLEYYSLLTKVNIARRKKNYSEASESLDVLISKLDHDLSIAAPIHKPYLDLLLQISKFEKHINNRINPDVSSKERFYASQCAVIDLKEIRITFMDLGMSDEVRKIDKWLSMITKDSGFSALLESPIKIPLFLAPRLPLERDIDELVSKERTALEVIDALIDIQIQMERAIKPYSKMREPDLRNVIVTHLNMKFEGLVTAETQSVGGKTDIHIPLSESHRLIAECKVWYGGKKYSDAISQLNGYLTRRDQIAVIITFCRKGTIKSTLEGVSNAIRNDSLYVSESLTLMNSEGTHLTSIHSHPRNHSRELKLHHIIFDLIDKKA